MLDEPVAAVVLCAAGAAMGFVNNLAGAGGAIALLAFDLAAGLPLSVANASMRPAALAIAGTGALGFATHGQRIPGRAFGYALWTLPGALVGTWLALELPAWVYEFVLFVVVGFLAVQLARQRRRPAQESPHASSRSAALWFSLVGLHMGFMQVGVGLLAILALSHIHSRNLVHVNVAKMALVAVSAGASLVLFSAAGAVAWGPALWLATGAAIGSFTASRWSVRRGHGAIRAVILVVCALVMIRIVIRFVTSD